jgi:hypothetical protein
LYGFYGALVDSRTLDTDLGEYAVQEYTLPVLNLVEPDLLPAQPPMEYLPTEDFYGYYGFYGCGAH